jgi:hypothetical protein
MISAFEHGRNTAHHGKHIQACPFDTAHPMARMAPWVLRRIDHVIPRL